MSAKPAQSNESHVTSKGSHAPSSLRPDLGVERSFSNNYFSSLKLDGKQHFIIVQFSKQDGFLRCNLTDCSAYWKAEHFTRDLRIQGLKWSRQQHGQFLVKSLVTQNLKENVYETVVRDFGFTLKVYHKFASTKGGEPINCLAAEFEFQLCHSDEPKEQLRNYLEVVRNFTLDLAKKNRALTASDKRYQQQQAEVKTLADEASKIKENLENQYYNAFAKLLNSKKAHIRKLKEENELLNQKLKALTGPVEEAFGSDVDPMSSDDDEAPPQPVPVHSENSGLMSEVVGPSFASPSDVLRTAPMSEEKMEIMSHGIIGSAPVGKVRKRTKRRRAPAVSDELTPSKKVALPIARRDLTTKQTTNKRATHSNSQESAGISGHAQIQNASPEEGSTSQLLGNLQ